MHAPDGGILLLADATTLRATHGCASSCRQGSSSPARQRKVQPAKKTMRWCMKSLQRACSENLSSQAAEFLTASENRRSANASSAGWTGGCSTAERTSVGGFSSEGQRSLTPSPHGAGAGSIVPVIFVRMFSARSSSILRNFSTWSASPIKIICHGSSSKSSSALSAMALGLFPVPCRPFRWRCTYPARQ